MRRNALRLAAIAASLTLTAAACGEDDPTEVGADPAAESDGSDPDTSAEMADDEMADHDPDEMADGEMGEDGHDHDRDEMADGEMGEDGHDHDPDEMADHDPDEMADGEMGEDGHDHGAGHETVGEAPTVAVEVVPDPVSGVNVFVTTDGFTLAPEHASTEHVAGEGHFHLYVDGEKLSRFYNTAIHVEGIPEGTATFEVELSGNDHGPYTIGGEPIRAVATVEIPAHDHSEHDHGEVEARELDGSAAIDVTVETDPKEGWNLHVDVSGLTLSPEHASAEHVDGEGHLHVYVDDIKLARLYGADMHVAALPEGEHTIRVAAYTNDHRPYEIGGIPVESVTTVVVES